MKQKHQPAAREAAADDGKKGAAQDAAPPEIDRDPAIPEINEVNLVGRLVNDPWVKEVAGGHKRASFMLLAPHTYHNAEGKKGQDKSYVPVVAWRAIADRIEGLKKGAAVQVGGRLKTWSKEGKYHWEVEANAFEVLDHSSPAETGAPAQEEPVAA